MTVPILNGHQSGGPEILSAKVPGLENGRFKGSDKS